MGSHTWVHTHGVGVGGSKGAGGRIGCRWDGSTHSERMAVGVHAHWGGGRLSNGSWGPCALGEWQLEWQPTK
eukprot:364859-Chlamydomonas_euryale.AAC.7